jgi:hypothetical protein
MQQLVILLLINCSSTCFRHLYAHHQEVRLHFTASGFLSCCSCCDVEESGCKLCAHSAHSLCPSSTRPQPAQTGVTACVCKQSCSPDDGHNDARNMLLNQENKHQIVVTSRWFYCLPTLMMHGHTNIKLGCHYVRTEGI